MSAPIVLRYFAALGRAQPLRHALADAGLAFDDVRVSLADWPRQRDDPELGGPLRGLPTLTWGDVTIGETLPIATFLARRLGRYRGLDDVAIARLEAVASHCYLEVLLRVSDVLWADLVYPGADLARAVPPLVGRLLTKLDALEEITPRDGWFGGVTPGVADCFAGEAIEATRYLLGTAREDRLRARLPGLFDLADRIRARPAIAREWDRRPPQFTTRADEPAALARIQAVDLRLDSRHPVLTDIRH